MAEQTITAEMEAVLRTWLADPDVCEETASLRHASLMLLDQLEAKIEGLREELAELTDESFRQIAHECKTDVMVGWWDSMALSTARGLGDRLVELGTWERHPDGCGRRWFYRPIDRREAVGCGRRWFYRPIDRREAVPLTPNP